MKSFRLHYNRFLCQRVVILLWKSHRCHWRRAQRTQAGTVFTSLCSACPTAFRINHKVCDNQSVNQSIFYHAPKSWPESWPTLPHSDAWIVQCQTNLQIFLALEHHSSLLFRYYQTTEAHVTVASMSTVQWVRLEPRTFWSLIVHGNH